MPRFDFVPVSFKRGLGLEFSIQLSFKIPSTKAINVSVFSSLRWYVVEQFFLMATRCSDGHRPLIFLITLLFSVLTVGHFCFFMLIVKFDEEVFNSWTYERVWRRMRLDLCVTCARSLYSFLTLISLLENYQQHMITKPKNLFTTIKIVNTDYFRYVMTRPNTC